MIDISKYEVVNKIFISSFSTYELVKNQEDSKNYILQTISVDDTQNQKGVINDYISTLSQFDHPTFTKFLGFSDHDLSEKNNISLLFEYTPNASLLEIFESIQKKIITI